MKAILLGLMSFLFIFNAEANTGTTVFQCVDGARALTIYVGHNGELLGHLAELSGVRKMKCERIGDEYKCVAGQYIASVKKQTYGRALVEVHLLSGSYAYPLYGFSCR